MGASGKSICNLDHPLQTVELRFRGSRSFCWAGSRSFVVVGVLTVEAFVPGCFIIHKRIIIDIICKIS